MQYQNKTEILNLKI